MLKRPRGRPRKGGSGTNLTRKTAVDILSENNLPVKNLYNSQVSAIVRSVDNDNGEDNSVTQDLKKRKRGIVIQSEAKKQCAVSEKDSDILVPSKLEEQLTTVSIILNQKDELGTTIQSTKRKRRVRFELPKEDDEKAEGSEREGFAIKLKWWTV
ncbi:unnamed protein product [Mucor hiemalis]